MAIWIAAASGTLRRNVARFRRLVCLAWAATAGVFRPPFFPGEIARSIRAIGGPDAMLPVVLMLATMGAVAALQGVDVLRMFGADRLLSGMLVEVTIRDLAPTMAALMLAAQAGTAISGELGAMHVGDEAAALRAMSVDPVRFLVVPRLVALTVVTPVFSGVGAIGAIASGFVAAVFFHGASAGPFIEGIVQQLSLGGILESWGKAAVFGFLVGLIACFHGMEATGGSEGVGRAVNRTVVQSIIVVAGAEALLTALILGFAG